MLFTSTLSFVCSPPQKPMVVAAQIRKLIPSELMLTNIPDNSSRQVFAIDDSGTMKLTMQYSHVKGPYLRRWIIKPDNVKATAISTFAPAFQNRKFDTLELFLKRAVKSDDGKGNPSEEAETLTIAIPEFKTRVKRVFMLQKLVSRLTEAKIRRIDR